MASSGLLRRVVLARTDIKKELSASIIRVTRIGELGKTLAVTSSRRQLLVTANVVPSSPILVTLMVEALISFEMSFLREPHSVTSQKAPFFVLSQVPMVFWGG
jgi:hypothetical protein